ncbi:MAG: PD-(D/E)XK nuclease family protein [Bacteroidaceae bacterium]|nr:PD-(D/E)XK nuclease family protein [Bacteroidaceae bacterium]
MKTFLEHVAESLLQQFGSNLSKLTVVFPGKRASLFLNQALAEQSPTPVWAPRYMTISELFQELSSYSLADPLECVCRLHASYSKYIPDPQSLDRFWSWGEILLADFDDVDKHLVDARALFSNIADLQHLDDNSYITPEQEQALRAFFGNFTLEDNSELKQQFLRLWNCMGDIYDDFLDALRSHGVLYEGALQRDVVTCISQKGGGEGGTLSASAPATDVSVHYAFVGFNVLNDVEQALFSFLQSSNQALFYWDYDVFYTESRLSAASEKDVFHEAGFFLRQNLKKYPNMLPDDCFDNLRSPKKLSFITATSENAQARYIPQWLSGELTSRENRTAVVLCNEQLLQPVLHSIPSPDTPPSSPSPIASPSSRSVCCSDDATPSLGIPAAVNITMGFPLTETPVFSLVMSLVMLQTDGYDASRNRFRPSLLRAVENHPFIPLVPEDQWRRPAGHGFDLLTYLLDIFAALAPAFADASDASSRDSSAAIPSIYRQLYAEALFKVFTTISRLRDLLAPPALAEVNDQTLRRLLRTILQTQTVPFHGEPATGLQVMGVLETRALDFEHILLLSVGEGFLPKTSSDTSLIPYALREAFGLTTVRHKMAVYAYYFYRLIQRASHVTFVYNESNAGLRKNEMSRFLRQLLAETDFPISCYRLGAPTKVAAIQPFVVEKTPDIIHKLRRTFDQSFQRTRPEDKASILSPTAINSYTACPMSFYYKYVRELKVLHEQQEEFDAIFFGDVFHYAAEQLYRQLTSAGDVIRKQDLEPFLDPAAALLQPIIREAFRVKYFGNRPEDYSGILIVAERVMESYLQQLIRHDMRLTPFTIVGLEEWVGTALHIDDMEIYTGGIVDRLDMVDDTEVPGGKVLRIVDYKTGGNPSSVAALENLFHDARQIEEYYLQTFLYASIVADKRQMPVCPCLFFVHKAGADNYSPKLKLARQQVNDISTISDDFLLGLSDVIREIFNPDISFTQTNRIQTCSNCVYRSLCGR